MTKNAQARSTGTVAKVTRAAEARRPEADRLATVKGAGALAGSDFKIRTGIDLLKPIAEQALGGRHGARNAG